MKNNYIQTKIFGLPKPLHSGRNTSSTSKRIGKEYIHRWQSVHGLVKYRVLIKRQNVYRCRYFKTMKEAKLFVEMLRANKYF